MSFFCFHMHSSSLWVKGILTYYSYIMLNEYIFFLTSTKWQNKKIVFIIICHIIWRMFIFFYYFCTTNCVFYYFCTAPSMRVSLNHEEWCSLFLPCWQIYAPQHRIWRCKYLSTWEDKGRSLTHIPTYTREREIGLDLFLSLGVHDT